MKLRTIHATTLFLFLIMLAASTKAAYEPTCSSDAVCLFEGYQKTLDNTPEPDQPAKPDYSNVKVSCSSKPINDGSGRSWDDVFRKVFSDKSFRIPREITPDVMCGLRMQERDRRKDFKSVNRRTKACSAFQIIPSNFMNKGGGLPYNHYNSYEEGKHDPKNCFEPENSLRAAIMILKEKHALKRCNGNITCAINGYYGFGKAASGEPTGSEYVSSVLNHIDNIRNYNYDDERVA